MVQFFRNVGFEYIVFYGMTETAGTIALNRVGDKNLKPASVGQPWRSLDLRISEEGEILVKGPILMEGYLEEEDNVGAFTEEGYFRTGDLGRLDKDGYLFVEGRKKNLIVLSTGKKVAPEPIENALCEISPIVGAVLLKDGEKFISAGLFISTPGLKKLKEDRTVECIEESLLKKIQMHLQGRAEYKIPKKIFIIEGAPLDFPDILTHSLKIKREVFCQKVRPSNRWDL